MALTLPLPRDLAKKNQRQLRRLVVSPELLLGWLKLLSTPDGRRYRVDGLPADVTCVGGEYDTHRQLIALILHSDSFPPVALPHFVQDLTVTITELYGPTPVSTMETAG